MRTRHPVFRHIVLVLAYGTMLGMAATLGVVPWTLVAAETPVASTSGSGTFVSFKNGALTIKGNAGLVVYKQVGENYKSFQNNEDGPGSKLVGTVDALSRVLPGTVLLVNVEDREISFGLDYRVIGTFESYDRMRRF